MASIVLSSLGASIGNEIVPGIGGQILGYYGRQLGRWADTELGLRKSASAKDGPRLGSLRVQDSRYGIGIPLVFGCVRVSGNIIWISDLIETSHETQTSGGKGGIIGGSSGSTRTTYSYSVHCAVAIAAGEIGGIATIWADSKVIYQNGIWKTGVVDSASFYKGTATQEVNPFLESMIGTGNTPAYRGLAYIVLESLQLSNFGNRLPNLTFEVLPADVVTQPLWLGDTSSNICHRPTPVQNKGMAPLVSEGTATRARRMLVGGYNLDGGMASFSVAEYDVTGDEPIEMTAAQSNSFAVSSVTDHAWSMAPDGRFVALQLRNGGTPTTYHFVIYDTNTHQFGTVYATSQIYVDTCKKIAWLDANHFAVSSVSSGRRGVHVFARAGMSVIDLGFFDVWGANTATTRLPLFYTSLVPLAGGLLNIMADSGSYFTTLYARHIVWQNNTLMVGSPYTIISGISTGSGSGPHASLLRTADDEWTLFFATVIDMRMMSFRLGTTSAVLTRPWQQITNASFGVGTTNHPVVFGNRIVVAQRSSTDNYYRISEISLNESNFGLVTDGAIVGNMDLPSTLFGAEAIDGARLMLLGLRGSDTTLDQIGIVRRCNTGDTLDRVVAGILERAGYASDDYDVTALADVALDGYVVPEAMSAASAIAPLRIFEPFDLVESGVVLKAVKHGNTPVLAIPFAEGRATNERSSDAVPFLEQTRVQELDLPLEVRVDYIDAARDYDVGSQRARRSVTKGARFLAKVSLPLVSTAAKAKQIAEARLFTVWAEREQARLTLSRRYLAIEPGDVIDLSDKRMRVSQVRLKDGIVDMRGVLVPPVAATSGASADAGEAAWQNDLEPVASALYLMDLPLLRAADDQPGIYAAVSGIDGWPGANVWRAADGVNYSRIAGFSSVAKAGMAVTVLGNGAPYYMDRASTVDVQLLQGALASCSETDLLGGANAALLGDEIIQFQNATLQGPGLYRLSNLLRGRRGTEETAGDHEIGERFVVLSEGAVQFIPALLTDRNRTYNFRALSNGQSLSDVPGSNVTYDLVTLRPMAPAHLTGTRSAGTGSDLTINWIRRARKNGDWIDNVDVPLDETEELYDVEIMDGANVVRTYGEVTTTSQLYGAADQTSDWGGSIPSQFTVNVYQRSGRYGRGQKASAVI